jgi:hypothetical protein
MKAIIMLCILSLVACDEGWNSNNIAVCADACKSSGSKMVSLTKAGCMCSAFAFPMPAPMLPMPTAEDAGK